MKKDLKSQLDSAERIQKSEERKGKGLEKRLKVMFTHIQSVYFDSPTSHLPSNLFTWNHSSKTFLGSIHGSKVQLMNLVKEECSESSGGGGFVEECTEVILSNRSSSVVQVGNS